ncbi:MAG: hypothetical protein OK404_00870 [Thaumarchaeota archaeon]|nr:hypothetical protein [Nitrososphaerota archaeon]
MSRLGEPRKPYSFNYWLKAKDQNETSMSRDPLDENLMSIRATLLEITTACDIRELATGPYCDRHGQEAEEGAVRCHYFSRRMAQSAGAENSKSQIQEYVIDVLGIRDATTVRRLTGKD